MSTVALTGASGFIGQAIADRLCQAGLKVRALVRTSKKIPCLEHPNITRIQGNLHDIGSLNELVEGCTGLIHSAGTIRGLEKKDFFPTNIQGIDNLLRVCPCTISPSSNSPSLLSGSQGAFALPLCMEQTAG